MIPLNTSGWQIFPLLKDFFLLVLIKYLLFPCHLATVSFLEQEGYMFNPTSPPTVLPLQTRQTVFNLLNLLQLCFIFLQNIKYPALFLLYWERITFSKVRDHYPIHLTIGIHVTLLIPSEKLCSQYLWISSIWAWWGPSLQQQRALQSSRQLRLQSTGMHSMLHKRIKSPPNSSENLKEVL